MTILILLAIVWIVVLGSQLWKRRSERRSTQSVWAFRRQLVTLRKRYAGLTPIDDFRHSRSYSHGSDHSAEHEYSAFSAYETMKVAGGGMGWSSHESLSMVRVIGPQAAYADPVYAGDFRTGIQPGMHNARTDYCDAADNSSVRGTGQRVVPSVEVLEASSQAVSPMARSNPHASAGSHSGAHAFAGVSEQGPHYGQATLQPSVGNRPVGNRPVVNRPANHRVEYQRAVSAAVRRRRILAGMAAATLLSFLVGLIPAIGFFMFIGVLGVAFTGVYIVLLVLLAQVRRAQAGRASIQPGAHRSYARHLATVSRSASGSVAVTDSRSVGSRQSSSKAPVPRQAMAAGGRGQDQAGALPGQGQARRELPSAASYAYGVSGATGLGSGAGSRSASGYQDYGYDREPAPVRTVG
ncbi:MAG: hypothetical protein ACYDGY_09800 [Acidimicrobiales bacterium]